MACPYFLINLINHGNPGSEVYRLIIRNLNSVFHTFTDRRVRVDTVQYFLVSCFQFSGRDCLYDYLSHIITDHVSAKPFAVFSIENNFYKSFRVAGC